MPLVKRRRPSCLAVACTLALFTLGLHRHRCGDDDDHEIMVMSFFAHAALPNNDDQPTSSSTTTTAITVSRPPNYYELLNLESPDTHRRSRTSSALNNRKKRSTYRSKIGTSDIKKAYRKQAQMYHPDKARNKNITTQEATSRFAEIAEAYQILIDPQQRYQYDWELLELEEDYERDRLILEQQQQNNQQRDQTIEHQRVHQRNDDGVDASFYDRVRHGASNFNAWKSNLDPWAVFEEFFFQDESIVVDDYGYQESKSYTSYHHDERRSSQQYNTPTSHDRSQPHVHETTIYQGYDPDFGADRYTVFRREEYIDRNYFRILGQDFIAGRQLDSFTGFTLQQYYSAVTEPYFVDEGYLITKTNFHAGDNKGDKHDANDNVQNDHDRQQTTTQQKAEKRYFQSRLDIGESFTPNDSNSNPWISPNEDYRAILTSTCELQIISNIYGRNNVIWSSETYIPNTRAHGCHLTLNSIGQLVLSVDYVSGLDSIGNSVLWETPLPRVVPHRSHDDEDGSKEQQMPVTFQYYASLDDDGVIAIYRVLEKLEDGTSTTNHTSSTGRIKKTQFKQQMRPMIDKLGIMYHRVSNAALNNGQTKASIVWDEFRYKVGRIFTSKPTKDFHSGVKKSQHECVYSTSPLGCLIPGRNAIVISRKIVRSIHNSIQLMDAFLKSLVEPADDYNDYYTSYPYYQDDEEDNILDTLLRVTGTVGANLGKVGVHGIHAAHHKLKQGGKIAGRMVGKMKKRVGTESVRWGQKLHERAEADSFSDIFF